MSDLEVRMCREHFTALPCWRCATVALAMEIDPRIKLRGGWKGDGPFPETAQPLAVAHVYRGGAYDRIAARGRQEAAGIKRRTIVTNEDGSCVDLGSHADGASGAWTEVELIFYGTDGEETERRTYMCLTPDLRSEEEETKRTQG